MRTLEVSFCQLLGNLVISYIRMFFSLIFAFPGILMLIPLGLVLQYAAEKERRKALNSSSVKVKAVDVMASVKVGTSVFLLPIYCLIFLAMLYFYLVNYTS